MKAGLLASLCADHNMYKHRRHGTSDLSLSRRQNNGMKKTQLTECAWWSIRYKRKVGSTPHDDLGVYVFSIL